MATLAQRIIDLAVRVGTEAKALRTLINGNAADLSALNTTAKGNLVLAVNELVAEIAALDGASIDDLVTALDKTWSSTKIDSELTDRIADAIAGITNGAPGALDTLDELSAALGDDANFAATITAALANRVRVDTAAQGLTNTQKTNARTNIDAVGTADIGNPDTNFVSEFNTALA